jgi:outer membrane biosynthesis protein TonB
MSPRLEIERAERDEAQDEPRRRGQGVRVALLALAVAGLVGGSWWAGHRSTTPPQDIAAVPEIHPDTAPVKEPPKDPGGMVVPGQDSVLLNREAKGKPEELLPPAEAVKPRPAPPSQAATANAPQPAPPSMPSVDTAPQTAGPTPAPQVATAPPPTAVAPPTPVAPKAAAPAPAVPKVAPTLPVGGSYRLQLGALKTEDAAKAEWLKLQRQNSDVLGKLSLSISRVELGAKGTYYRIQAGPIADEGRAAQSCAALKSRSVSCILVKP